MNHDSNNNINIVVTHEYLLLYYVNVFYYNIFIYTCERRARKTAKLYYNITGVFVAYNYYYITYTGIFFRPLRIII